MVICHHAMKTRDFSKTSNPVTVNLAVVPLDGRHMSCNVPASCEVLNLDALKLLRNLHYSHIQSHKPF